jgi:pimeloyl-ACP methyl ester carboxylesterase
LRRVGAADPLVILAGGPGQGARGFGPVVARYFKKVRRTRPVVLVDLRGTGGSAPLVCPTITAPLARPFFDVVDAAQCRDALEADPRFYTHASALADLDDIRRALGYDRINLWGGSWGTRAALLYAVTYPTAVRSVVLDGAVSMAMGFPQSTARNAERAWELLAAACHEDRTCNAAHGNAGETFRRLLEQLEATPYSSEVRDPRTGERVTVRLDRDTVAEIIRVALYTPGDAARVLQIVRHAVNGNYGPLLAQAARSASVSTDEMAVGQTLSVLCSEDMPLTMQIDFSREARGTFLRSSYADAWRRRCREWPIGKGLWIARDATSTSPALILSGEHDPVTPPSAGEAMALHFVNHRHVVVPGAAHNASFSGCVPDLIADFITRGSLDGLETSCASRVAWPPIVIDDAGTVP